MNSQFARFLMNYNQWAHARVWACIDALTDEQFYRSTGYAFDTIHGQVVHVAYVENRWLARIQGVTVPPAWTTDDLPDHQAVKAAAADVTARWNAYLDTLTDAALAEVITYDMPHRGGLKQSSRAEIIAQVVNHATDHRAQILAMIHMVGGTTAEQDIIFYAWEQTETR